MAKETTEKPLPKVSILDRRLAHPFGAPSVPITLKTKGQWAMRVVYAKLRSGRLHQMEQAGWVFVTPKEIDGRPEDLGFRAVDDRLVKGEHGDEVLMKMPQKDFDAIQMRKAEINLKNLGSSQTRDSVAQATAVKFGPEAGDTVHANLEISDGRAPEELENA